MPGAARHWDVPAALGDWRSRDVAFRYADYAAILAARFGDRIRHWIVLNEPNIVSDGLSARCFRRRLADDGVF